MNKYKIKSQLREIKKRLVDNMNQELNSFGFTCDFVMTEHFSDRIIDRSLRPDVDLTYIEDTLTAMIDNYLGYVLYKCNDTEEKTILLYKKYRRNVQECFGIGVSFYRKDDHYEIVVRTFIPACRMSYVRDVPSFEVKPPRKKIRLVSPLQKMLYSENCPDVLKVLR